MIGIELPGNSKDLRNQLLYEEKIFTGSSSDPNVLRLLPPMNIGQEEIDLFLEKFEKVLSHSK
jgi:acetylornithine aminotransferase